MASWIQHHNVLKQHASLSFLTPSQSNLLCVLQSQMQYANRINLYGDAGVGKTFLAWVLCAETGALYVPSPARLREGRVASTHVVVDDVDGGRDESREIWQDVLQAAKSALLITRSPIQDHVAHAHLQLRPDDLEVAVQNMSRVCGFHRDSGNGINLWAKLRGGHQHASG